jgi:hypothetical protein
LPVGRFGRLLWVCSVFIAWAVHCAFVAHVFAGVQDPKLATKLPLIVTLAPPAGGIDGLGAPVVLADALCSKPTTKRYFIIVSCLQNNSRGCPGLMKISA